MIQHYRKIPILIFLLLTLTACLATVQQPSFVTPAKQFRLILPDEGLYQISAKELDSLGIPASEISKLRLSHLGKPHPYWIYDNPSGEFLFHFYAPAPDKSSIVKDIIFLLEVDEEETSTRVMPHMIPATNKPSGSISEGVFTHRFEEQVLYLPDSKGVDRWFWTLLNTDQPFQLELFSQDQVPSPINVSIKLWSPSSSPMDPDHSVSISINQKEYEVVYWKDAGEYLIDWQVVLEEPVIDNTIRIRKNEINGDYPQKIYLDWVEIQTKKPMLFDSHMQYFKTDDEVLYIQSSDSQGIIVSFSQGNIGENVYLLPPNTTAEIPNSSSSEFVWVPANEYRSVPVIQPIELQIPEFAQVDYLVIAPQQFHSTLQPLLDLRTKQGLDTLLVSPQQIYDWANSGTPDPHTIRLYIQHLAEIHGSPPKFLLLVGDYSYQPKTYETSIVELPSFLVDTSLAGQTVSDFPYSDLDGNWIPDLSIGRIPSSTPEQLEVWVQKVLSYENKYSEDLGQIITISDPGTVMFEVTATEFLTSLDKMTQTNLIHLSGEEELFSKNHAVLSDATSLLFYFGHGSIDRWGKTEILSSRQLQQLQTQSIPAFVFSFSCLNGYFVHPEKESLSEVLLFHPHTETIALLNPTSLTMHENQVWLSKQINSGLQLKRNVTFGEFITSAMREIDSENQLNQDILKTFILLGDPATRFPTLID